MGAAVSRNRWAALLATVALGCGGGDSSGGGGGGTSAAGGGGSSGAGAMGGGGTAGTAGTAGTDPCKVASISDSAVASLIHAGSGMIDSPKDHPTTDLGPITSPADCRGGLIDIVIMPEGYQDSELPRFDQDAALWLKEFKALSPFKEFLDAFNVWTVRLPSKEHITTTGADTLFSMKLTSSGSGVEKPSAQQLQVVAQAFYEGLRHVPVNRVHKSGTLLKQVVGVVLVLDLSCPHFDNPDKECDDFSGWSRNPQDPNDASTEIKVAVARNRMHEFGHALALLKDEYRDDQFDDDCTNASKYAGYNPSNYAIDNIANYSYSNSATDLPWAHLLHSAGTNSTPDLIGAYQGAFTCWEGAWRPEFRCLMNGTHGNSDSCNPSGGAKLRQDDFCNWCRELVALRIFDSIGLLNAADPFKDWVDSYRAGYWQQYPVTLPNDGMPILDTCGAPVPFEAPK